MAPRCRSSLHILSLALTIAVPSFHARSSPITADELNGRELTRLRRDAGRTGPRPDLAARRECVRQERDQVTLTPSQFEFIRNEYPELRRLSPQDPPAMKLKALAALVQKIRSRSAPIQSEEEMRAAFEMTAFESLSRRQIPDCGSLDKSFMALAKAFGLSGLRMIHITTLQTYRAYCPRPGEPRRPLSDQELMTHLIVAVPQGGDRWLLYDPDLAKDIFPVSRSRDFMGQVRTRDLFSLQGRLFDLPGYDYSFFQWITGIHTGGGLLVNAVGLNEEDSLCIHDLEAKANVVASSRADSDVCAMTPETILPLAPVADDSWGF